MPRHEAMVMGLPLPLIAFAQRVWRRASLVNENVCQRCLQDAFECRDLGVAISLLLAGERELNLNFATIGLPLTTPCVGIVATNFLPMQMTALAHVHRSSDFRLHLVS